MVLNVGTKIINPTERMDQLLFTQMVILSGTRMVNSIGKMDPLSSIEVLTVKLGTELIGPTKNINIP
jgi:hypothetical protein